MEILKYIILVIYIIVCIALIILAAVQNSEKQGASTNNFYEQNKGRTKEGKLKKWTIILGITFAVLAIVLGILYLV